MRRFLENFNFMKIKVEKKIKLKFRFKKMYSKVLFSKESRGGRGAEAIIN